MVTKCFLMSVKPVVFVSGFLIVMLGYRGLAADELEQNAASASRAASETSVPIGDVVVKAEENALPSESAVMELLSRFPKLMHFLVVHSDQLPRAIRDRVVIDAELRRVPIIMNTSSDFEPVGLMNPPGKHAVLKFVEGERLRILKPGDSIEIEVTVIQDFSGAVAVGFWSAKHPGIANKPNRVHIHNPDGFPLEPGPALAMATARHLDKNGGLIDEWTWDRMVELEAVND
jgi:hypothetical protein